MSRLHLIIFVLHWKMCLYLHWHFQVLNDSDLVHRPTYLLPFYLLNEVACTCHVSRIRRRVPLDNCSLWPWSSSLIIYQQVRLRLCIGTDLTFLRSFSLTTASILVKAFSTCVTIMKPFLKPDVRAICLHVWSQKNSGCNCDSTFPTFEISLIKSSLGSLCAGNALGDGQDRLFVIFNCILSTGAPSFHLAPNYLPTVLVFPFTSETHLLFTYSPGDRESTHGTEKTNGIPNIICRNRGTES